MLLQLSFKLLLHIHPHPLSLNLKLSRRLTFLTLCESLDLKLLLKNVSGLKIIQNHFLNCLNVFSHQFDKNNQHICLLALSLLQRMVKVVFHHLLDELLP